MNEQQVIEQLQPIFRDILDNPSLTVGPADNASTVQGWGSLAHISIISIIEQDFDIQFNPGDLEHVSTVGEMASLIVQKLNGRA